MGSIFDESREGRCNPAHFAAEAFPGPLALDEGLRQCPLDLPRVYEADALDHYASLLRAGDGPRRTRSMAALVNLEGFLAHHPLAPDSHSQGILGCLHELQEMICALSGMHAAWAGPAGASGLREIGADMMRAGQHARGEAARVDVEVLELDGAMHDAMPECGLERIGEHTAGIMVFERLCAVPGILDATTAQARERGALVGCICRDLPGVAMTARTGPGRFDLLLMETPPAAGDERWRAIGAGAALGPHLPAGRVVQYRGDYRWADATLPGTGSARAAENVPALLAAYAGMRMQGGDGFERRLDQAIADSARLAQHLRRLGVAVLIPADAPARHVAFRCHADRARLLDERLREARLGAGVEIVGPACVAVYPGADERDESLHTLVALVGEIARYG